jgi:Carbohydrate esterase, sialic acid-specific acetylesterase
VFTVYLADSTPKKVHLFILSGQSNMLFLDPNQSFTPSVTKAFSGDEIIVVKDALARQPISRWYKKRKPAQGEEPKNNKDLYDRLMTKIKGAINGKTPSTITFVWMQGETDAKKKSGDGYAASLKGLIGQLREDLKRKDINFVIGRLSDFDNGNKIYPHWTIVRQAQVEVAESDPRGAWVDTDGLNIPNNVHYTGEGYKILGERFAAKAIELIKKNNIIDKKPYKTDASDGK